MSEAKFNSETSYNFLRCLPANIDLHDPIQKRLVEEYGSVFVARGGATPPNKVVYESERDVDKFQASVESATQTLGNVRITLQKAAMEALSKAVAFARNVGLSITPRGAEAAARTYAETVTLWASRVEPALEHWVQMGKLEPSKAEHIRSLTPFAQVWEVLSLEERGLWFAKDLSKTILHSAAPPGTSQHLSMLALDVAEFDDPRVREILSLHGWFQTVTSDLPHFTFLGMKEDELSAVGLKRVESNDRHFWVPDI